MRSSSTLTTGSIVTNGGPSGTTLSDLDWRAKTITIVQHKTGRPLNLPLLHDVGWAIIDYVRAGRPETACPKVFVKHRYPGDFYMAMDS